MSGPQTLLDLVANRQVPDSATPAVTLGEVRAAVASAATEERERIRAEVIAVVRDYFSEQPTFDPPAKQERWYIEGWARAYRDLNELLGLHARALLDNEQ